MKNFVDSQGPRLAESFSAFCALEGFLFRMNVPVTKIVKLNIFYYQRDLRGKMT